MKKIFLLLGLLLSSQVYSQTIIDPYGETFQSEQTEVNRGWEIAKSLVDTSYYEFETDEYWSEFSTDWQTAYYIMNYLTVDDNVDCDVFTGKKYLKHAKKKGRKGEWEYNKDFDSQVMDYCTCSHQYFSAIIYVYKDGSSHGFLIN